MSDLIGIQIVGFLMHTFNYVYCMGMLSLCILTSLVFLVTVPAVASLDCEIVVGPIDGVFVILEVSLCIPGGVRPYVTWSAPRRSTIFSNDSISRE